MTDNVRTLKEYFNAPTFYAGQDFTAQIGGGSAALQTIPTTGNFTLACPCRIIQPNNNSWIMDNLQLVAPTSNAYAGGFTFAMHCQKRVDLSGFLQMGAATVPLGSASQRASVPQLPGRWDTRFSGYTLTYMRDFTIWSVEELSQMDIDNLISGGIIRQSITPNMPSFGATGGSMTNTQMMSSQSRLFVSDSGLSSVVGWLREMFAQQGGMGETTATTQIYCTRVVAGQASTPSADETAGLNGTPTTQNWAANKFFISIPPSWEILNVGIIEPDELEYLTYMQRSVLAPEGRVLQ